MAAKKDGQIVAKVMYFGMSLLIGWNKTNMEMSRRRGVGSKLAMVNMDKKYYEAIIKIVSVITIMQSKEIVMGWLFLGLGCLICFIWSIFPPYNLLGLVINGIGIIICFAKFFIWIQPGGDL